jgi:ATPase family protein associated with various cellular activities (AAA)
MSSSNKQTFLDVVPEIIQHFGLHPKRRDLMGYCLSRRIQVPLVNLKRGRVSHGIWNLEPYAQQLGIQMPAGFVPTAPAGDTTNHNPTQYHQQEGSTAPLVVMPTVFTPHVDERTDAEIEEAINNHFALADMITTTVIDGDSKAMILSGNPGIGKTYTVEYMLENAAEQGDIEFTVAKGYSRPTGLFKLLYMNRMKHQILLIDDMDSVFGDTDGLNLLKAALDTTKRRDISWLTEREMTTPDGEVIPKTFLYEGRIIFITNLDFEREIQRHGKIAEHLTALMSRCDYVDLNLRTQRELMIRIRSVVRNTEIVSTTLNDHEINIILQYIEEHMEHMRELSLRMVVKLRDKMLAARGDLHRFKMMADGTVLRKHGRLF